MSGAGDNPDEALVSQARAGNKRAFSQLVEHETGRLLALGTRMLSSPSMLLIQEQKETRVHGGENRAAIKKVPGLIG